MNKISDMQGVFRIARRVAFVALVVRALVPVGWMPDAHGLTICPDGAQMQQASIEKPMHHDHAMGAMHHGQVGAVMDHGDHGKAPAQHGRHDICPFAAAPHFASVPVLPQLALPAVHAFAVATNQGYAHSISARFTPQSPRAPPLTV